MPRLSKNARRNARRRQKKRKAKAQAKETCGLCATAFCQKCPNCCRAKVPADQWKVMGCQCGAPKICVCCGITHVKQSAKRHCLEIDCTKKIVKCPWCRVDMDVTNVYDNAIIE